MRPWLRRRRRFEGDRYPSDREAAEAGADGLESAVNWMQHVLGRDFDSAEVTRCVIVAEVKTPHGLATVYTTHSVDAGPVEVRGLLGEGVRALDELQIRARRQQDIEHFVTMEEIRRRHGTEPGTLEDFEAAHGPVQPPDGEG